MANPGEVRKPAVREVEQPARRRDQDVASDTEALDLRHFADAAENHAGAKFLVCAVDANALADLRREFARRGKDERARDAALGRAEHLEQRQHEGRRLAGARLGAGEQVAAGKHGRNCPGLDWRRGVVTVRGNSRKQLRLEARDR